MLGGWIKLHRCFLSSSIWENANLARFWIWCLLKAAHSRKKTRVRYIGVELAPGQFIFGRHMAANETGLSENEIRSCVKALKMENAIDVASHVTRQFSIVTIVKWEEYQVAESDPPQPFAGDAPTGRQASTTIKNDQEDQETSGVAATPSPPVQSSPAVRSSPAPSPSAAAAPASPRAEIPDVLLGLARTALRWAAPEPALHALLADYPDWWIEEAAKEAALGGTTNADYVRGILRRYGKNGGPSRHGNRKTGAARGKYADIDAANFGH